MNDLEHVLNIRVLGEYASFQITQLPVLFSESNYQTVHIDVENSTFSITLQDDGFSGGFLANIYYHSQFILSAPYIQLYSTTITTAKNGVAMADVTLISGADIVMLGFNLLSTDYCNILVSAERELIINNAPQGQVAYSYLQSGVNSHVVVRASKITIGNDVKSPFRVSRGAMVFTSKEGKAPFDVHDDSGLYPEGSFNFDTKDCRDGAFLFAGMMGRDLTEMLDKRLIYIDGQPANSQTVSCVREEQFLRVFPHP